MQALVKKFQSSWRLFRLREFHLAYEACSVCRFALSVQFCADEMGVRCARCGASAVTQSLVDVLKTVAGELSSQKIYEMSAAGPLVNYLLKINTDVVLSEYFENLKSGQIRNGILAQDVQALSFDDAQFDLCTSSEVFEHVEDDARGFAEIYRVLKPSGWFIFTVPLSGLEKTFERTEIQNGQRAQTAPAEYHADRYRGANIFCYRNYGRDILQRLQEAGFVNAQLITPRMRLFGFARTIVVAQKL